MKHFFSEIKWFDIQHSANEKLWESATVFVCCFYVAEPNFYGDVIYWDAKLWTADRWEKNSEPVWDSGEIYSTSEEAKAVCQRHYEEIILNALTNEAKAKLGIN